MTNACYECGTPVPDAEQAAFREALAAFAARSGTSTSKERANR